jgi:hypothetical protein
VKPAHVNPIFKGRREFRLTPFEDENYEPCDDEPNDDRSDYAGSESDDENEESVTLTVTSKKKTVMKTLIMKRNGICPSATAHQ